MTSPAAGGARARILGTAARLFYERGIRAVGVDTLIAESGVAKATFYKHFPAKDDLVLAYLDTIDEAWTAQLQAAAQAAGDRPADQLVGVFAALGAVCDGPGYRGCGFLNAAAETPAGSRVHDRIVAHKASVRDYLAQLARAGGASDPEALARTLSVLLDGGLAAGTLEAGGAAPSAAAEAAQLVVAAALPPAGRPRRPAGSGDRNRTSVSSAPRRPPGGGR